MQQQQQPQQTQYMGQFSQPVRSQPVLYLSCVSVGSSKQYLCGGVVLEPRLCPARGLEQQHALVRAGGAGGSQRLELRARQEHHLTAQPPATTFLRQHQPGLPPRHVIGLDGWLAGWLTDEWWVPAS